MRSWVVAIGALALASCAAPHDRFVSPHFQPPTEKSRILVMRPDVRASQITAMGARQERPDWAADAEENLSLAFQDILRRRGRETAAAGAGERETQLKLLNEAVADSLVRYSHTDQVVRSTVAPTKAKVFDWTLGEGAVDLGAAYHADLALFTVSDNRYASSGRFLEAAFLGMGLVGSTVPGKMMGSRWTVATLVDLHTGQVVWMSYDDDGDPRHRDGAQAIADRLAARLPF
jgi:hypothetical protein